MAATSEADYTPAYRFDNTWRAARQRLQCLEECCDPLTDRNLDRVGLGAGWHCLEVGAGAGSVVRRLCERVGRDGRVVAVDLEPALLDGLAAPNLEVRQLDVVAEELPEAAFDLVHTRAVLMHIPQRMEVLPKLVRALRPGGVLLLEEVDISPGLDNPDEEVFRRSYEVMERPITAAGADLRWAATMSALLGPAGLVDVGGTKDRMTFTGASPLAEFFRLTWLQLLESQPYTDEERAAIEAGRDVIARPGGDYVAWDFVAAWGRRP